MPNYDRGFLYGNKGSGQGQQRRQDDQYFDNRQGDSNQYYQQ